MKITEIEDIKELAQLLIDAQTPGTNHYQDQLLDCIKAIDQKISEIDLIHRQIKNIQMILSRYQTYKNHKGVN